MSRRSRKNDTEVTLLPFLAVLVCTMGALIVLLVVVMQQAQVAGSSTPTEIAELEPDPPPPSATLAEVAPPSQGDYALPDLVIDTPDPSASPAPTIEPPASQPPVSQPPTIESPVAAVPPPISAGPAIPTGPSAEDVASAQLERDNYLWEIKTLSESHEQSQQQLSGKALQLTEIDEETQRLIAELEQLQKTVDDASADFASTATPPVDADELAKLQSDIAAKQNELATLQAAAAENQKTRYQLVPYNGSKGTTRRPIYVECRENEVVLQPEGITLTAEDFALAEDEANPLAATLRAIREYWNRTDSDSSRGEPYPLLVVRPGGERLYLACRRAMKAWDNEFGYELVEKDIELAYPEKDSTLATIITDTRDLARQQQAQMLRMIAAMQPDDAPTYRAAYGGGFVMDGEPGRRRRGPQFGGSGRGNGSGNHPGNRKGNSPFSNGADIVLAKGQPSGGSGPNSEANGPFGDGTIDGGSFDGGSFDGGSFGGGDFQPGSASQGSAFTGSALPNGQSTFGDSTAAQSGEFAATAPQFGSRQLPGGQAHGDQNFGGQNYGGQSYGGQGFAQGSADGQTSLGQSGNGQNGQPQSNFEMPEFAPGDTSGAVSANGSNISQNSLSFSGMSAQSQAGQSQAGVAGQGANSGSPNNGSPSNGSANSASTATSTQTPQGASVSIAQYRGENWALPNAVQGAIPAERPLFIALNTAQLVLEAEPGTRQVPAVVTFQNGSSAAVQSLVTTIWERIKTWGVAGPGVYWRPKLRFDVAPDAQATFDELAVLLEGSGLEVQRN